MYINVRVPKTSVPLAVPAVSTIASIQMYVREREREREREGSREPSKEERRSSL